MRSDEEIADSIAEKFIEALCECASRLEKSFSDNDYSPLFCCEGEHKQAENALKRATHLINQALCRDPSSEGKEFGFYVKKRYKLVAGKAVWSFTDNRVDIDCYRVDKIATRLDPEEAGWVMDRTPRRQCDVLYAATIKLWEAQRKLKERGGSNDQDIIDDLREAEAEIGLAAKLRR
jgi:hypothetical protein